MPNETVEHIRREMLETLRDHEESVMPIVSAAVDEGGREPRAYARGRLREIVDLRNRFNEIVDAVTDRSIT